MMIAHFFDTPYSSNKCPPVPDTGDHPRRYAIAGLRKGKLTKTFEEKRFYSRRVTWRDRDGGDKQLLKNRESHSEVCVGVGCQLNRDQILGLLDLKGLVRARDSMLRQH